MIKNESKKAKVNRKKGRKTVNGRQGKKIYHEKKMKGKKEHQDDQVNFTCK